MYCQLNGCRKHHSDLIVNDYKQEVHHQYIARCSGVGSIILIQ